MKIYLMKDLKNIYPALFTVSGINQDFKILKNVSLQTAFIVSIKYCTESIYKIYEKKLKECITSKIQITQKRRLKIHFSLK